MRTHFWYKGIPALLFLFFMVSAQTVSVPTQYSTVAQALQFGTDILVTANITENIVISSMTVSITGADTNITITGKTRITNSTVIFTDIKLAGTNGASSSPVVIDYFGWQEPPPCPTPIPGGNGDTACIAINSTVTIINGSIKGGAGGASGHAYVIQYEYPMYIPCALGASGTTGIGLCASQYTTVDTTNTALGIVVLDSTSSIIPGTSAVAPSARKELKIPSVRFLSSGAITVNNFDNSTNLTVAVYSMAGRLIYTNALKSRISFVPRLDRGVYVVTITNGKQKVCGKFVKTK